MERYILFNGVSGIRMKRLSGQALLINTDIYYDFIEFVCPLERKVTKFSDVILYTHD